MREYVRAKLCKSAGGDCRVSNPKKTELNKLPVVIEAQWQTAVGDFRQSLGSYNLSPQDQDRIMSAVNGMKKDFVHDGGMKTGTEKKAN